MEILYLAALKNEVKYLNNFFLTGVGKINASFVATDLINKYKPKRTPNKPKKSAVLAKKGSEIKIVRFGDPKMSIKKDQPARRSNFRARHNCDTAKDKFSARYWSCKAW